jgi:WS/DGAT C-terminal domain
MEGALQQQRAAFATATANSFASVFVPLDLREREPAARLQSVRRQVAWIKGAREAAVSLVFNSALYRCLPMAWFVLLLRTAMNKGTFYVSNLQGPRAPITFAGARVTHMFNFVNPSLAFVLSVMSYSGTCSLSVAANGASMPEPQAFLEDVVAEVAALEAAVAAQAAAGSSGGKEKAS